MTRKNLAGLKSVSATRRAAAAVELAFVLPVYLLLGLATVEATSMIFLKQSLKIAAYEAARVSLIPGSNQDNVFAAAQELLDSRDVQAYAVSVTPGDFPTQPYGTEITVQITAACAPNSLFSSLYYGTKTFETNVTMMKEN